MVLEDTGADEDLWKEKEVEKTGEGAGRDGELGGAGGAGGGAKSRETFTGEVPTWERPVTDSRQDLHFPGDT